MPRSSRAPIVEASPFRDDRHPAMAEAIDSYFKQPDSHFVVIGVGHMFGDNNLLEALAKRGVQARRVE